MCQLGEKPLCRFAASPPVGEKIHLFLVELHLNSCVWGLWDNGIMGLLRFTPDEDLTHQKKARLSTGS